MPEGSRAVLRDADLLAQYMNRRSTSQAALARAAGCSRQFIHQLLTGGVTGCTWPVASKIEEYLGLIRGTLFVSVTSLDGRHVVVPRRRAGART